eukprot:CAMPEP_0201552178 /NCGR_PEP_ID=MMETSP0173_2-20130828/14534_1 /ASSEMBLY_ACC=CAM_ASM_000268 /TAXON_ID=218659 /ORGANISM="Vexillifera sp., Strain DIVA3 564/2" /LENGTH=560 /DNA_ID=CAMNT_0047962615 /DNA_START=59 /DNA_END=1741 /DNA_ORIENTATION=-
MKMMMSTQTSSGHLGSIQLPAIKNEPCFSYAPGSRERGLLRAAMDDILAQGEVEVPCIVGGKEVFTGNTDTHVMPSKHAHVLARFHEADESTLQQAVKASREAKESWASLPLEHRLSVFRKAGDMLASDQWRYKMVAATMLGQSKNIWQAEIEAAAESVDFFRFCAKYALDIYKSQPEHHDPNVWNRMEYRPLEGFVLAISPFNFTAIAANLPTAPAIMGNTVVWKPSSTAMLSNYYMFQLMREAGLPDGVVNFTPGSGSLVGSALVKHPEMTGIHFTGSTKTFNTIWRSVADSLDNYKTYPRIVGETGGKNFAMVHESAHYENTLNNIVRGAFEYQGQKCSATSRLYVPRSMWESRLKSDLVNIVNNKVKQGCPTDFEVFMCAVIDKPAFDKISGFINRASKSDNAQVIAGGKYDESTGYFIEPTVIETTDPHYETMCEEIFGPVLTVYAYDDDKFDDVLALADRTSQYGLTGAIFAQDRHALEHASSVLRNASGNVYYNDKSTGAIVGQQPFGGARKSGTNDKAGHAMNLLRWTSVRSIKENFVPITDFLYPHNQPGN